MKLKRTTLIRTIFFTISIFLFNTLSAQTEQSLKLNGQEYNRLLNNNFKKQSNSFQPYSFEKLSPNNSNTSFINRYQFNDTIKRSILFKNLTFKQNKSENIFPNLGVYEHFDNSFKYNINDKIDIDFGIGLVKQNSILSSNYPGYQFSFHSSIEYAITNWLSAYIYGQYITLPINKPKDFFDPLIFMNPLFIQTEIGGGLKAKYKNIKADFGVKAIQNTQFKNVSPVGTVNSKIIIGF